jgi:hypothetical protein
MIKALMKLVIEEMYLNIIKALSDKSIAKIILTGEKLKTVPLKSDLRKGVYILHIQHSLGIPSQSTRQEK